MNKATLLTIFRFVYFVITGLIVIPISLFFGWGGIAENYEGSTEMPAPEYLWLIAIWIIGLVLQFWKLWVGVMIAIIPVVYFGALVIYVGYFI